jgi:hypothetical protein
MTVEHGKVIEPGECENIVEESLITCVLGWGGLYFTWVLVDG